MPFPLMAIGDRRALGSGSLPSWAAGLAEAGVPALQLREKDLADGALFALATLLRSVAPRPVRLLVNGRPDIALAADADGVHLPADGLPTAAVRRRWPEGLLVGRSTHAAAEVETAAAEGAHYVTFGPVYASPGKGDGVGVAALAAVAALGVPVLALGGVSPDRLRELAAAGAAGAAGIRAFLDPGRARELAAAAREVFPS